MYKDCSHSLAGTPGTTAPILPAIAVLLSQSSAVVSVTSSEVPGEVRGAVKLSRTIASTEKHTYVYMIYNQVDTANTHSPRAPML